MKTQTLRTKLGELRDSLSDRLGITKKRVAASPRKRASPGRRVTFGAVKVTEFERLLCGGGGVPDGDVVSLGLGAEVRSYETVPRDRPRNADKDTYCMRGCLDVSKRAELLCEWMRKKEYLVLLRKIVKPELLRLQRGREASNAVPKHLREMPSSLPDALAQARQDEAAVARLLAAAALTPSKKRLHDEQDEAADAARDASAARTGAATAPLARNGNPIRSPKRSRPPVADGGGDDGSDDDDADDADDDDATEVRTPPGAAAVARAAGGGHAGAAAARDGAQARPAAKGKLDEPSDASRGKGGSLGDNLARWLVWRDF